MENQSTVKLLEEVHRASQMGIEAIDELLKKAEDNSFKQDLMKIQNDYKQVSATANNQLQNGGGTPYEVSSLERLQLWGVTNLKTAINRNSGNLANMMIKGIEMGIKLTHKTINENPKADLSIKEFSNRYISLQQSHIMTMENYLN